MDKMRFESPDITEENIEKISELFPGVVTEGKVNFDLLRSVLGDEVHGDEAYEFTWVGKRAAIAEAGRPIRKTLRPVVEDETIPTGADSTGNPYCSSGSKNWDITENLYIEGDNLDVLKLLQESYLGKVKMIYIDPPYNTGNDFVYRDKFSRDKVEYDEEAGVYDEDGDRLFRNTESNGRFHSDWCSMMYPRLVLARNLLREDGVIFISIDDNEIAQLRKICDEVFGESNFITDIIWEKRYTRNNDAKLMSTVIDHILCFRKSEKLQKLREPRSEKQNSAYSNPDDDPRGVWTSVLFTSQRTKEERPNLSYPIKNPFTGEIIEHPTNAWKYSSERYEQLNNDGRLYWGKSGSNSYPRIKRFLSELDDKVVPINLWYYKDTATLDEGTKLVDSILGKDVFDYPKPIEIVQRMLKLMDDPSAIVLDFFSGSATAAHAVMQLNVEDGGKRKFIMVQLPEVCDEKSEAAKAGYANIAEIGKERIRRAGEKIKAEAGMLGQDLDTGFRVLKLDSTNMRDVYYSAGEYTQDMLSELEDNIKDDRTDMDLLYACLLDWGLPLSMPHTQEQIDGFTVHTYNDGDLIACFDKDISDKVVKEIARRCGDSAREGLATRAVFRDLSFADSPSKINVEEIFNLLAPNTSVRVI